MAKNFSDDFKRENDYDDTQDIKRILYPENCSSSRYDDNAKKGKSKSEQESEDFAEKIEWISRWYDPYQEPPSDYECIIRHKKLMDKLFKP